MDEHGTDMDPRIGEALNRVVEQFYAAGLHDREVDEVRPFVEAAVAREFDGSWVQPGRHLVVPWPCAHGTSFAVSLPCSCPPGACTREKVAS